MPAARRAVSRAAADTRRVRQESGRFALVRASRLSSSATMTYVFESKASTSCATFVVNGFRQLCDLISVCAFDGLIVSNESSAPMASCNRPLSGSRGPCLRTLDCAVVDLAKSLVPSMPPKGAPSMRPYLQEIDHEHFRTCG